MLHSPYVAGRDGPCGIGPIITLMACMDYQNSGTLDSDCSDAWWMRGCVDTDPTADCDLSSVSDPSRINILEAQRDALTRAGTWTFCPFSR